MVLFFWTSVPPVSEKWNKFEKLLCIKIPNQRFNFFSRTEPLCFTLVNEVINMVHGAHKFLICSGMVNHSSTIAPLGKEGWTSLVGFKSHRLPYQQQ